MFAKQLSDDIPKMDCQLSDTELEVSSIDKGIRGFYCGMLWRAAQDLARLPRTNPHYQSAYRFFFSNVKPLTDYQITFSRICEVLKIDLDAFRDSLRGELALVREQKKRRFGRSGF